ncbi:MAG: hypothetical protein GQE15_41605 [Archangiaceae bacterium]|nr:hypothetical protein [Archangiaceae bacterium]
MTYYVEPIRRWTTYAPGRISAQAHYFNFEFDREQRLRAEPARIINVLDGGLLQPTSDGQVADVVIPLPTEQERVAWDTLEVDLLDDCPTHTNCDTGRISLSRCSPGLDGGADCNEFARWTSGRRGRWVTDVSSMLPLVAADADGLGRFRIETGSGPQAIVSLSFRLLDRARGTRAATAIPLWTGGLIGSPEYEASHQPIELDVPADASKVELFTILTDRSSWRRHHSFIINGVAFDRAPDETWCTQYLPRGLIPNQEVYVAWNGCRGFEVTPEVTDVTSAIRRGERNTITYAAIGVPSTLDPVRLASWLVISR